MYPENIELHAPPGKVRLIGEEHGRLFVVGDYPENTPLSELRDIAHMNRGVGIDIRIVDDEGESLHEK